jgi:hypothetical protein
MLKDEAEVILKLHACSKMGDMVILELRACSKMRTTGVRGVEFAEFRRSGAVVMLDSMIFGVGAAWRSWFR